VVQQRQLRCSVQLHLHLPPLPFRHLQRQGPPPPAYLSWLLAGGAYFDCRSMPAVTHSLWDVQLLRLQI
jgi:hypothetical protein